MTDFKLTNQLVPNTCPMKFAFSTRFRVFDLRILCPWAQILSIRPDSRDLRTNSATPFWKAIWSDVLRAFHYFAEHSSPGNGAKPDFRSMCPDHHLQR